MIVDMMDSDPGTAFTYNTAGMIGIDKTLENATGERLGQFANTCLGNLYTMLRWHILAAID